MRKPLVPLLLLSAICGLAWGQPASAPPASDADIIMQMAHLATPDRSTNDPGKQLLALLENIQKLPSLLERLESQHPNSQFLPDAYSLTLNAMVTARQYDPVSFSDDQIAQIAQKLMAVAKKDEHKAQGRFVLLQLQGLDMLKKTPRPVSRPASMPSSPSAPAATLPTTGPATMASTAPSTMPTGPIAELAEKFIAFSREYSQTGYAAQALLQAGGLYLEAGYDARAAATLERLAHDFPKEPTTLTALMILARFYQEQGQSEKSMQAKRVLVEQFPDSPVALKYKADVARETVIGKGFEFRGKSAAGQQLDSKELVGKPLWVYFFGALTSRPMSEAELGNIRALRDLAEEKGYNLIGISAEPEISTKATAEILSRNQLDVPVFLDPEGIVATTYGVAALPAVLVVDKDGKVKDVLISTDIVAKVRNSFAPSSQPTSMPSSQP